MSTKKRKTKKKKSVRRKTTKRKRRTRKSRMKRRRSNPYLSASGHHRMLGQTPFDYQVVAKYPTSERATIKQFELEYNGWPSYSDIEGDYTYSYFSSIPTIKMATDLITALETVTGRNQFLAVESTELKKNYLELRAKDFDRKELAQGRAVYDPQLNGGAPVWNQEGIAWYEEDDPLVLEKEAIFDRWESEGYKGAKKVIGDLWRGKQSSAAEDIYPSSIASYNKSRSWHQAERQRPWNRLKRFVGVESRCKRLRNPDKRDERYRLEVAYGQTFIPGLQSLEDTYGVHDRDQDSILESIVGKRHTDDGVGPDGRDIDWFFSSIAARNAAGKKLAKAIRWFRQNGIQINHVIGVTRGDKGSTQHVLFYGESPWKEHIKYRQDVS